MEEVKRKIRRYSKGAIEYLEMAMGVIEDDDSINNGQNDEIQKIYIELASVVKTLENL
ncbi:hypothetical protein H9L25_00570 [Terrisporobacter mayombei]|nr:hypothetical protein [Terrisporobacter mayombei]